MTPAQCAARAEVERLASPDRKLTSNHFCRMAAQQSALDGLPKRQPMEAWPVRGLVPLDASTAERPAAFALTSWPVNPPNCQTGRDLTAEHSNPIVRTAATTRSHSMGRHKHLSSLTSLI